MFNPNLGKAKICLALSLTAPTLIGASAYADSSVDLLDDFVVVGETTNTVVTPESLEKYQANDLADVFRHVPSVTVGGSIGIAQKIYIRGLEDTFLNITVDGAPQTGTLFHHIGRVSLEPELLKEVDVQAGAGEATSGAGAIGGAIRFKTKNAEDLLREGQRVGGIAKLNYFSNDGVKGSLSAYGKLTDDWGLLGSYVKVDRDNMEDGDGNTLLGTEAEQDLLFVKLNGHLTKTQDLTLSFEQRKEEAEVGQRPNWPTLENDPIYPMEGERNTFIANHNWRANQLINLETTLYYTESEIIQDTINHNRGPAGGWGKYQGNLKSFGFDLRNTSRVGQHKLTYGVDYRDDKVSSEYLNATDAQLAYWAWDPDVTYFEETGDVFGVYVQDHWQLTDALLLSMGARYDRYTVDEETYGDSTSSNGISPNIGFSYQFTDELKLTAGYAEAMRGKEVGDAFTLERRPGTAALQTNLQAEDVTNTEIGLEYTSTTWMASASIYRSEINDVIQDQIGSGVFYENVGELETDGFELMLGYQWDSLSLIASYVQNDAEINGREVEGYEHIGIANSRGDTLTLDLNYQLNDKVEMGWYYTHVEALDDVEVLHRAVELGWIADTQTIDKPGYNVHDIYLRWLPTEQLTFDFTVVNLFDEQYRDHSSVGDYNSIAGWEGVAGLNEAGRDIRVTASYRF